MKVYFNYGDSNNKKKPEQKIIARLSYGTNKLDKKISTKISITKNGWNFKRGEEAGVVNLMTGSRTIEEAEYFKKVQDKLNYIREYLKNEFRKLKLKPEFSVYNKDDWNTWAKEHFEIATGVRKAKSEKAPFYLDKKQEWIDYKRNKVGKGTLKGYNSQKKLVESFMSEKKHNYRTDEIDLSFYNEFQEWCYEVKEYTPNYFGLQISKIKAVIKHFRTTDSSFKYNVQILNEQFKAVKENVYHEVLFPAELEKLWNYKGKDYLENARDISIILYRGCLRWSEFYEEINKEELSIFEASDPNTNKKVYKWNVHQKKVKERKAINVHSQIVKMWKENNLPRKIELQKFNDYIKELCLIVGIDKAEEIASHTFRRSFCTNMYNDSRNDVRSIMEYSGHKTETMLMKYIQQQNVTRTNTIPTE